MLSPHHCKGCFNPETWPFNGGKEFTLETLSSIVSGLTANGVRRHLSLLGGEPLCAENAFLTSLIIKTVKDTLPETKIYIWTGYIYEELLEAKEPIINNILQSADYLVDGPYKQEQRDITLNMRGSANQRIIDLKTGEDVTSIFEN